MNRFVIFYVSEKNSLPFRERPSGNLGRRKWGFLSGPLSKTWLLYRISAKLVSIVCLTIFVELSYSFFRNIRISYNYPIISVICLEEDILILAGRIQVKGEIRHVAYNFENWRQSRGGSKLHQLIYLRYDRPSQ